MRRSILTAFAGISALAIAAPANAIPTFVSACDATLTNPNAISCSGYWDQNLLGGSPTQLADQEYAIDLMMGAGFYDTLPSWAVLDANFKIEDDAGDSPFDFGVALSGLTLIGAHFGNVAGPAGNVTVFYLLDLGAGGTVTLDDTQGWSNAVLYTTGTPAVPEPATWAMMLLGFAGAGIAIRRSRRKEPLAQLA